MLDRMVQIVKIPVIRQKLGLIETDSPVESATMDLFREILLKATERVDSWGGIVAILSLCISALAFWF
jgi:hypothetical protein